MRLNVGPSRSDSPAKAGHYVRPDTTYCPAEAGPYVRPCADPGIFLAPVGQRGGVMNKEKGAIGYILLWAMGVPATLLFLIFLLRGCN